MWVLAKMSGVLPERMTAQPKAVSMAYVLAHKKASPTLGDTF
jgi:hypothetical protein